MQSILFDYIFIKGNNLYFILFLPFGLNRILPCYETARKKSKRYSF
jgi:hypothetical protein